MVLQDSNGPMTLHRYDPVFRVQKLDGSQVWRRRHYRVRRAQVTLPSWCWMHMSTLHCKPTKATCALHEVAQSCSC